MAKEFKLRWGYEQDFETIKLAPRELGCAVDTNKFFLGTSMGNMHIPNETFVAKMIVDALDAKTVPSGTATDLSSEKYREKIAFNTTTNRLQYKDANDKTYKLLTPLDVMSSKPVSVQVSIDNIDTADGNSVSINNFNRPIVMVFLNGVLCTEHQADPHRIVIDTDNRALKVYGCSENDIISYY
jgi:hypothetical protein